MKTDPITLSSNLLGRKLADEEWVFLNLKNGVYYGLNETGSIFWDELSAHRDPGKALARLEEIFGTERDSLEKDVKAFLNQLQEEGLIENQKPPQKA